MVLQQLGVLLVFVARAATKGQADDHGVCSCLELCGSLWSVPPPEAMMMMSLGWGATGDSTGVPVHVGLEAMLMSLACAAVEDSEGVCGPCYSGRAVLICMFCTALETMPRSVAHAISRNHVEVHAPRSCRL